ncbi:probable thiol-disulfide oxidoreductase ResA [Coccomyxa sp. Obi]|nr:probable thiol-disulfide oxidoreductase ResA [Coccomyxa sp. Obi]
MLGQKLQTFTAGHLKFLKGEPVDVPPTGSPAVIELWATWCAPCRAVFPHLSEIAHKYKDKGLKVVSICVEQDSPALQQFVDQQGSKMEYTVAVDPQGVAGQQLMATAKVSGIPHAFVVDRDGIVQFSGHPMDPNFEAAVKKASTNAEAWHLTC